MPGHGNTDRVELEDDLFPLLTRKLHQVLQSGFWDQSAVADLRGARDARPPPRWVHILSILCSFRGNLAKSYVGAPWRVGAPTSEKSWMRHWSAHICFTYFYNSLVLLSLLFNIGHEMSMRLSRLALP